MKQIHSKSIYTIVTVIIIESREFNVLDNYVISAIESCFIAQFRDYIKSKKLKTQSGVENANKRKYG